MGQEALVINDGLYKRKNIHCAQSLYLIGKGLLMTGNADEAMKALKEAVDIFDSIHGREAEGVAKSLYWIGWVLDHKGDYDGALKSFCCITLSSNFSIKCKLQPVNYGLFQIIILEKYLF